MAPREGTLSSIQKEAPPLAGLVAQGRNLLVRAALPAGFRRTLAVLGKIAAALLRRRARLISAVAVLAALASGFGGQLAILRERALFIGHALAALARDIPLLLGIHRRETLPAGAFL